MNNDSNARRRRPPKEQAEFEAMLRDIPELRRLKESGHSFADVWDSKTKTPLNPLPTEAQMEEMASDSTVEAIVQRAFAKTGHRYVPKAERQQPILQREVYIRDEHDDEQRRIFYFPRIPRQISTLMAAGIVAVAVALSIGGGFAASYMRQQATNSQVADERAHLKTTVHGRTVIQTEGPSAPRTFDMAEADIHGVVREGSLELNEVGSAPDSMVKGTLSLLGDVIIEIGQKSAGMVLTTPTADVKLLLPGKYTIVAPNKQFGYVTVIDGLAWVDDRGTPLDMGKVTTGQTIKTRAGQLPTRNMREP